MVDDEQIKQRLSEAVQLAQSALVAGGQQQRDDAAKALKQVASDLAGWRPPEALNVFTQLQHWKRFRKLESTDIPHRSDCDGTVFQVTTKHLLKADISPAYDRHFTAQEITERLNARAFLRALPNGATPTINLHVASCCNVECLATKSRLSVSVTVWSGRKLMTREYSFH